MFRLAPSFVLAVTVPHEQPRAEEKRAEKRSTSSADSSSVSCIEEKAQKDGGVVPASPTADKNGGVGPASPTADGVIAPQFEQTETKGGGNKRPNAIPPAMAPMASPVSATAVEGGAKNDQTGGREGGVASAAQDEVKWLRAEVERLKAEAIASYDRGRSEGYNSAIAKGGERASGVQGMAQTSAQMGRGRGWAEVFKLIRAPESSADVRGDESEGFLDSSLQEESSRMLIEGIYPPSKSAEPNRLFASDGMIAANDMVKM